MMEEDRRFKEGYYVFDRERHPADRLKERKRKMEAQDVMFG